MRLSWPDTLSLTLSLSVLAVGAIMVLAPVSPVHAYRIADRFNADIDVGGGAGRYFTGSLRDGYTCGVCHVGAPEPDFELLGLPNPQEYEPGTQALLELTINYTPEAINGIAEREVQEEIDEAVRTRQLELQADPDNLSLTPEAFEALVNPTRAARAQRVADLASQVATRMRDASAVSIEFTGDLGEPVGQAVLDHQDPASNCANGEPAAKRVEIDGRVLFAMDVCGATKLRVSYTFPEDPTTVVRIYAAGVIGDNNAAPDRDGAASLTRVMSAPDQARAFRAQAESGGFGCQTSLGHSSTCAWLVGIWVALLRRRQRIHVRANRRFQPKQ